MRLGYTEKRGKREGNGTARTQPCAQRPLLQRVRSPGWAQCEPVGAAPLPRMCPAGPPDTCPLRPLPSTHSQCDRWVWASWAGDVAYAPLRWSHWGLGATLAPPEKAQNEGDAAHRPPGTGVPSSPCSHWRLYGADTHSGDRGGDSLPGAGVGLSPKGWQMHRGPPHTGSSSLQLWAPQGGGHTSVSGGGKEKTWRLGTPRSPPCLTGADTLQPAVATHPQLQQPVWNGAGTVLIVLSNVSSAPPDCGCPSGHRGLATPRPPVSPALPLGGDVHLHERLCGSEQEAGYEQGAPLPPEFQEGQHISEEGPVGAGP